jgi:hypothetical protein
MTRASIHLRKTIFRRRWIAGSSPAMTEWGDGGYFAPQLARNDGLKTIVAV